MALGIAAILFAIFFANVCLGAFTGNAFMGDVGEMLTLLAASIAFVAAILKAETKAKQEQQTE